MRKAYWIAGLALLLVAAAAGWYVLSPGITLKAMVAAAKAAIQYALRIRRGSAAPFCGDGARSASGPPAIRPLPGAAFFVVTASAAARAHSDLPPPRFWTAAGSAALPRAINP